MWNDARDDLVRFEIIGGYVVSCCFLRFSVLGANPRNLLYTGANPARGLLNKENRAERESLAAHIL